MTTKQTQNEMITDEMTTAVKTINFEVYHIDRHDCAIVHHSTKSPPQTKIIKFHFKFKIVTNNVIFHVQKYF